MINKDKIYTAAKSNLNSYIQQTFTNWVDFYTNLERCPSPSPYFLYIFGFWKLKVEISPTEFMVTVTLWCHDMEKFVQYFVKGARRSPLYFPHKGSVIYSFDIVINFNVYMDKVLSKQWGCQWFGTPWHSCDIPVMKKYPCHTPRPCLVCA